VEVIEVNDVIVLVLRSMHEVSYQACILRDLDADGVVDCPHRGQSMNVRSDPAGALHEMLGIPRIAPLQNELDAPEHLPGAPGVDDLAAGHFDFNPHVAFDSGDRINRDSLSHMISSISGKKNVRLGWPPSA
jgi:hypothetical protein